MSVLGRYLKQKREALDASHSGYSIRSVARKLGIHHSYLSKLERGEYAPLSEKRLAALARILDEDEAVLMALGGKVPESLASRIMEQPEKFRAFLADLQEGSTKRPDTGGYDTSAEHRKQELEELNRRLRDEIRQRQELEQRLVWNEQEKLTILSNLKDVAIEYIDGDFNLLWASPNLQEHFSMPLDQAIGKKCHEVVAGSPEPCPHCIAAQAARTKQICEGEYIAKNGRRFQVRSVPILNERDEVERVVHCGFDVSELVRTEKALEESERRWKFALEGAQEGVWDWNVKTGKVFFSPRWKEMLGYGEEEVSNDLAEWDTRLHLEDRETVHELLEAHLRGETPHYESEYRLRCKDGSYKWVLDRGVVVERAASGVPLRAIGTHFDISHRKDAEERIRASETFLNALLLSIQDAISVLDPNLTVRYVNRKMEQWHADVLPLVGRKCHEVFRKRDIPCEDCPSLLALQTGLPHSQTVQTLDGWAPNWVELHSYPIVDKDSGETTGVVEVAMDVTRKKQVEDALRDSEARFRNIFENNPTVQFLVEPDSGKIHEANAAACAFYGHTRHELEKMRIFDINILPEGEIRAKMQEVVGRINNHFRFRHHIKDGQIRDVEVRSSPIQIRDKTYIHSLVIDVTHRRWSEALLRRAMEEERLLLHSIDTQIWYLTDVETNGLVNQARADFLGGRIEDFAHKKLDIFLPKEVAEACKAGNREVFHHGRRIRGEQWVRNAKGEPRLLRITKSPKLNDQGAVEFIVCSATDITDLQRAKTLLEDSERRYRELIENAPVGICTVTLDGAYLAVNPAQAAMYGYDSPERMIKELGSSKGVFIDPEAREKLLQLLRKHGVVTGFECEIRRKDGSRIWTSRTARAICDASGKIEYYESFIENIQRRKEAELLSEQARTSLITVLDQVEAGVLALDSRDGSVFFANAYLCTAMGRELVGENPSEALLDKASPERFDFGPAVRDPGSVHSRELLFRNGRWYLCRGKALPWMEDTKVVLVVATDITEMKKAEELRRDVDRIMRHDLKSPLNGIVALPELLLSLKQHDPEEEEMLKAIQDSGHKMMRLINESLSLYKLETGQYELRPQHVDLVKELQAASLEILDICQRKHLRLERRVGPRLLDATEELKVLGDPTLIPFLLSNLLKNAAEAAPPDSTLRVSFFPGEPLRMEFHNQGAVPEEVREHFFEKYATARKSGGTGLGTYSARLIARAHEGDIEMRTSGVEGTTINVVLPQQRLLDKLRTAADFKKHTT